MATPSAVARSPSSPRVALVTGANQGIGLEIVRQLCKTFDGTVILAARNVDRGQSAVKDLMSEGLQPVFLPLDVDDAESIQAAKEAVEISYNRLDVLVNNAGVMFSRVPDMPFAEKGRKTILTNYHGVLNVTNAFWSLLQPNSRLVNVSSKHGRIVNVGKERQDEILDPGMTIDKLTGIMDRYVEDCKFPEEEFKTKGWAVDSVVSDYNSYQVSKIGVNRLTELWADNVSKDPSKAGTLVNSMFPGWVRTHMGTDGADLSVEEGADTVTYLVSMPPGQTEPHGKYLYQRKVRNWKEEIKAGFTD